jgi:hypothetical protein
MVRFGEIEVGRLPDLGRDRAVDAGLLQRRLIGLARGKRRRVLIRRQAWIAER